ncbi:hypothetical protein VK792_04935 [Mesobacterium sp. TK19101]|uniref:Colicin transporter n=1 Tax=Mesobacterium hydrothermale TaxID=3111907 RepID=A0ABU6HFJ9_9RHOB|nr:hypothetical protein [Mesobacterium sp. TK19101]MEC3860620.1 hypothetical protein [Mesobacterium sp. TK19101]
MTQIDELERRIAAAFDRIGKGVEGLEAELAAARADPPPPQADPAELEALRQALADERTANAQLEERVRAIREKQESQVAALETQVSEQHSTIARLDMELQRLRQACDLLRENNVALRGAAEANNTDPHLINRSLLAELESLRAERAAENAELAGVMGALKPLLTNAGQADATADTGEEA